MLDKNQKTTFSLIVDNIIPSIDEPKRFSASEAGFLEYVEKLNISDWLTRGFDKIQKISKETFLKEPNLLNSKEQSELMEKLKRHEFRFMSELASLVAESYYHNQEVLISLGISHNAPFPDGNILHDSDLLLLEKVYLRGRIYR